MFESTIFEGNANDPNDEGGGGKAKNPWENQRGKEGMILGDIFTFFVQILLQFLME